MKKIYRNQMRAEYESTEKTILSMHDGKENKKSEMIIYHIFNGLDLIYSKFNTYNAPKSDEIPESEYIEINYCKRGVFECISKSGKTLYLSEGEIASNINMMQKITSNFINGYYEGIEILIDIDEFQKNLPEINPCKPDKYIPIFEEKLKDFFSVKNAIAVANGTAAIHLSLAALNIKDGDEVLVPANAVIMSVIPILYQKAIPIFVDCQENNIDFDYDDLKRKVSNKTKAVIPVYLWGCSYNLDKLLDFAKEYNIEIIEDACQAHGSKWNNKYLGTFGKFGCFSMKNGKILATGEGGFILTDDDELAERCRLLRNHCTNIRDTSKSFSEIGWNYRITEMQALLGIYNLRDLKDKINFRKNQTKYIYEQIKNITGINIYNYYDNENSNYFSPIFLHDKGLDIAKKLNKNRVINSTGTFGLIPANERKVIQEYCKNLVSYDRMKTPNSHKLFSKIVALSLMENIDRDKMNEIISKINQIVKEEN